MSPGPAPQFDRQEVLMRAMELFWSKGYKGTGMSELLKHVGIGRQSLYNAFGNKRSLFLEALRAYKHAMASEMEAMLGAAGSPLENIRAALRKRVLDITDDEECFQGCMLGNASTELGTSDPEVSQIILQAMQRVEEAFRRTFEQAVEEGELPAHADPLALARLVMATGQGLMVIAQSNPDPEVISQAIEGFESLLSLQSAGVSQNVGA